MSPISTHLYHRLFNSFVCWQTEEDEGKKKRKLVRIEYTDDELRARGLDPEGVTLCAHTFEVESRMNSSLCCVEMHISLLVCLCACVLIA